MGISICNKNISSFHGKLRSQSSEVCYSETNNVTPRSLVFSAYHPKDMTIHYFFYKLGRKCIANEFQFVIIYYKLGRKCIANAFQFVIIYYKLGRKCIANAFQFVIIYYNLGRNCIANACQFVIKNKSFQN